MKTLITLFIVSFVLTSCSKNCDEERMLALSKYQNAVSHAGDSWPALKKLQSEYENELAEIDRNCN